MEMMFVFGLGNPGEKYEHTRHNAGRDAVLLFAKEHDASWKMDSECTARISNQFHVGAMPVRCAIPETYMNNSGSAVRCAAERAPTTPTVVVVHDDIDLALGTVRVAKNKGAGGHNGVTDVIEHLGTKDFIRVRIGVIPTRADGSLRKPSAGEQILRFVLRSGNNKDAELLEKACAEAANALTLLCTMPYERAVEKIHRKNNERNRGAEVK